MINLSGLSTSLVSALKVSCPQKHTSPGKANSQLYDTWRHGRLRPATPSFDQPPPKLAVPARPPGALWCAGAKNPAAGLCSLRSFRFPGRPRAAPACFVTFHSLLWNLVWPVALVLLR